MNATYPFSFSGMWSLAADGRAIGDSGQGNITAPAGLTSAFCDPYSLRRVYYLDGETWVWDPSQLAYVPGRLIGERLPVEAADEMFTTDEPAPRETWGEWSHRRDMDFQDASLARIKAAGKSITIRRQTLIAGAVAVLAWGVAWGFGARSVLLWLGW